MNDLGKTAEERQAMRDNLTAGLIEQARERARRIFRTLKCGADPGLFEGWKHVTDPHGCKDDGSSCICECHDPTPVEESP